MSRLLEISLKSEQGKNANVMRCIQTLMDNPMKTDPFYDTCEQYATTMCALSSKDCEKRDVDKFCAVMRHNMTVHEKEEYCTHLVEANDKFWRSKFSAT